MVFGILDRYVFREITAAFLFCAALFLIAGIIGGFLSHLEKGMRFGLGLTLILFQILMNVLPQTLVTVIPLSTTIGILLGLGRMTADNEVAALKASGIPIVRLLPPVAFLGVIGFCLSLVCTLILIPQGHAKIRQLSIEAATTHAQAGLEERTIYDELKGLTVYVESIEPSSGLMKNLFIRKVPRDAKNLGNKDKIEASGTSVGDDEVFRPDETLTIIAREGRTVPDPRKRDLILNLRDGTIIKSNPYGDGTGTFSFEEFTFRHPVLDEGDEVFHRQHQEMSISEIREEIRKARERERIAENPFAVDLNQRIQRYGRMFIVQRFVHPAACIALALLAFPLGVMGLGKSRLNSISLGLVVIFAYYALTLTAERLANDGVMSPEIVLPIPPIAAAVIAVYFLRCVQMERTPWFIRIISRGMGRLRGTRA